MDFKIEKNVPVRTFNSPFCEALDQLEIGDSIGNLTKKEIYKYRPNFYTPTFRDRKFTFKKETGTMYRIWRVAWWIYQRKVSLNYRTRQRLRSYTQHLLVQSLCWLAWWLCGTQPSEQVHSQRHVLYARCNHVRSRWLSCRVWTQS